MSQMHGEPRPEAPFVVDEEEVKKQAEALENQNVDRFPGPPADGVPTTASQAHPTVVDESSPEEASSRAPGQYSEVFATPEGEERVEQ